MGFRKEFSISCKGFREHKELVRLGAPQIVHDRVLCAQRSDRSQSCRTRKIVAHVEGGGGRIRIRITVTRETIPTLVAHYTTVPRAVGKRWKRAAARGDVIVTGLSLLLLLWLLPSMRSPVYDLYTTHVFTDDDFRRRRRVNDE